MVAQALWHLSLPPNSEIPLLIHHDIQITNASLTAQLADENARSVVTMTFQPTNPRELDGEEDSEDEGDEDDFSGEEGSDVEDDGEELDEEEIAKAVAAATGGKSSKSKGKTNGSALPTEVEAEDEELDSDEDEEDISLTEEPVTSTLCALTPGKIEGISLNLILNEDEVVIFKNEGKNEIHLLGNYIDQIPFQGGRDDYDDMESESEYSYDSDEEGGPLDFDEEQMSEMEGMDIDMEDLKRVVGRGGKGKKSDSHRFEVVDEEESKPKSKKAEKSTATPVEIANAAIETSKKRKADSTPEKTKADAGKKLKNDKGEAVPAAAAAKKVEEKKVEAKKVEKKEKKDDKPEKASSKKITHPSGLVMEDVKVGEGPVAGKGKRCGMRYIGKLQNGKQFDANTSGAPFTFRLGAGEVIKGWDIGVAGMKVGGERKLTIPANLAYGNQKIPGIPPNSTLVFDIKLVNVK